MGSDSLMSDGEISEIDFQTTGVSVIANGLQNSGAASEKGVKDRITCKRKQLDASFGQFPWKRGWMVDFSGIFSWKGPDAVCPLNKLVPCDVGDP